MLSGSIAHGTSVNGAARWPPCLAAVIPTPTLACLAAMTGPVGASPTPRPGATYWWPASRPPSPRTTGGICLLCVSGTPGPGAIGGRTVVLAGGTGVRVVGKGDRGLLVT